MHRRGDHDHHERAMGLAMLGTIIFFVLVGTGIGAFFQAGLYGPLVGIAVGIAVGLWLVPRLIEEHER